MKRLCAIIFLASAVLVSCGKDNRWSDEQDAPEAAAPKIEKIASLEQCDRYIAFLECLRDNEPEGEESGVDYDKAIHEVRTQQPNQAAALCASSMKTLEEDREDVEKYGCQL